MRQVPNQRFYSYAIIGDGRMASHFCHYLQLLSIPYQQWGRRNTAVSLAQIIKDCDRALILIKDVAIENFIEENPRLKDKILIHFSGKLTSSLAHSAHPLMTFSEKLYDLNVYEKIPFILEKNGPTFEGLLPGLNNPHYEIPAELKNFYHSLCVMSGNFTCILWQKFFTELETTFQLPKSVIYPYLEQIFSNLKHADQTALTGPLARGDQITIAANLAALRDDPFQKIYQAFVDVYQSQLGSKQ